jgi:signal transduction histidine kinase
MNKRQIYLIFLILFVIILSFIIMYYFYSTKDKIRQNTYNHFLIQAKSILDNIKRVNNQKYTNLKDALKDKKTQEEENLYLSSFISEDFKNIFILYYDGKFFRVLADGTLDKKNRFLFNERFDPLYKEKYIQAIKTKKPLYFKQKINGLWSTYLYPVVKNDKVEYLITLDFSHKALKIVDKNLLSLQKVLTAFLVVVTIIVIVLVIFMIYDVKREEELQIKIDNAIKEIKIKDEQLILQSRMALMGEILSMIAHQWRQPLNVISTLITDMEVDFMLKEFDEKRSKERIDTIKEMIKHLSTTIDDFRSFYRKDRKKESFNIDKLIKSVLQIANSSLQNKGINIIVSLKCNKELLIYPNELKQILLNLIKNAQDVLVEREIKNPRIQIEAFSKNNKCIIEVKDNAGGVDEKIKDKIFEAYFTTKDIKNGTGLGLYMSRLLIQRIDGSLTQYNDNEGAVFRIEIKEN